MEGILILSYLHLKNLHAMMRSTSSTTAPPADPAGISQVSESIEATAESEPEECSFLLHNR